MTRGRFGNIAVFLNGCLPPAVAKLNRVSAMHMTQNLMGFWFIFIGTLTLFGLIAQWFNHTLGILLMSAAPGGMIGVAVIEATWLIHTHRSTKKLGPLPASLHVDRGENGTVLIATRLNGDITTLQLPEDYDPREDDGDFIFLSLLTPEQYADFRRYAPDRFFPETEDDE